MNFWTLARLFFAVTMIAVGLSGIVSGGFAAIWRPVPQGFPARDLLADFSALVLVVAGAGLLMKRTARPSALVLFIVFAIWTILFKGPFVLQAPLVEGTYQSIGENFAWVAAAWLLYIESAGGQHGLLSGRAARELAYLLYGLALLAFGFSHFVYLELTAPLVPKWLPEAVFWADLTGAIYLLSGAAILTIVAARFGAVLAAVQIALITLLVWAPMVLSGGMNATHWQESVVSCVIMVSSWVVAASFQGRPWLALSGSRPATGPRPFPSR